MARQSGVDNTIKWASTPSLGDIKRLDKAGSIHQRDNQTALKIKGNELHLYLNNFIRTGYLNTRSWKELSLVETLRQWSVSERPIAEEYSSDAVSVARLQR